MLRLTKKTEYGIIALKHILNQPTGSISSAKEISILYNIPQEIMAKILQSLARKGLLISSQGSRGGYVLAREGEQIRLSDIIESIEGPLELVACMSDEDCTCEQLRSCNINEPLRVIQDQLKLFLSGISLADINNEIEMRKVVWQIN